MTSDPHPAQPAFEILTDSIKIISPSGRHVRILQGSPDRESVKNLTTIFNLPIEGRIPTIPTGFTAMSKTQLHSIGIHRVIQGGIDSSVDRGKVFCVVMSGGYEEDEDLGDTIVYTGSGGQDKATGKQTSDQTLDRKNKVLAKCCAAGNVDDEEGADAGENWRSGSPIRVIRGSGVRAHDSTDYAPKEGFRYDGIYKVESYWPSTGYSGHRIWRYTLRRDDRSPAPWTEDDK